MGLDKEASGQNPFRNLAKKDKDKDLYKKAVGNNLDVKRVLYGQ